MDFVADALPDPTGAVAVLAPVAQPAIISARTQTAALATPTMIFVGLIDPSVGSRASF
jgi:hypothetical protein